MPSLRFISGSGTGSNVAQGVVGQIGALNASIANLNSLNLRVDPPSKQIQFYLNNKLVSISNPDPTMSLVDYIKTYTKYTGTKKTCNQGGCGVCTVMMAYYDSDSQLVRNISINSCLRLLVQCDGCAFWTVEGIGGSYGTTNVPAFLGNWAATHPNIPMLAVLPQNIAMGVDTTSTFYPGVRNIEVHGGISKNYPTYSTYGYQNQGSQFSLHPIQERMVKCFGVQCGGCTAGIIMTQYTALQPNTFMQSNTGSFIEKNFDGNLCRCSAYMGIEKMAKSFLPDFYNAETQTWDLNGSTNIDGDALNNYSLITSGSPLSPTGFTAYNPALDTNGTQHFIGASWMTGYSGNQQYSVWQIGQPSSPIDGFPYNFNYYRVNTLSDAIFIVQSNGITKTTILSGDTSKGIPGFQKFSSYYNQYTAFVDINQISSLKQVSSSVSGITFGSLVPINKMARVLKDSNDSKFQQIWKHLFATANNHVRNVATWAGNLMLTKNALFGSDLATVLIAANATLSFTTVSTVSSTNYTNIPVETFLSTSYPNQVIILTSIFIPVKQANEQYISYRVSRRELNCHALVNVASSFVMQSSSTGTISSAKVVFGAIANSLPIVATNTNGWLIGQNIQTLDMSTALSKLQGTSSGQDNVNVYGTTSLTSDIYPDGNKAYMNKEISSLFYQLLVTLQSRQGILTNSSLNSAVISWGFENRGYNSDVDITHNALNALIYPFHYGTIPQDAYLKTTGMAHYANDEQGMQQFCAYATSKIPLGSVNWQGTNTIASLRKARNVPGVNYVITAVELAQFGLSNITNSMQVMHEYFGDQWISWYGQPIAAIYANSQEVATAVASQITFDYNPVVVNTNVQSISQLPGDYPGFSITGALLSHSETIDDAIANWRYFPACQPGMITNLIPVKSYWSTLSPSYLNGSHVNFPYYGPNQPGTTGSDGAFELMPNVISVGPTGVNLVYTNPGFSLTGYVNGAPTQYIDNLGNVHAYSPFVITGSAYAPELNGMPMENNNVFCEIGNDGKLVVTSNCATPALFCGNIHASGPLDSSVSTFAFLPFFNTSDVVGAAWGEFGSGIYPGCAIQPFSHLRKIRGGPTALNNATLDWSKITFKVKRFTGGNFGNKSMGAGSVLYSYGGALLGTLLNGMKTNCWLPIQQDMTLMVPRPAFKLDYTNGFNEKGQIISDRKIVTTIGGQSMSVLPPINGVGTGPAYNLSFTFGTPYYLANNNWCSEPTSAIVMALSGRQNYLQNVVQGGMYWDFNQVYLPRAPSMANRGYGWSQAAVQYMTSLDEVCGYLIDNHVQPNYKITDVVLQNLTPNTTPVVNYMLQNYDYTGAQNSINTFNNNNKWKKRAQCLLSTDIFSSCNDFGNHTVLLKIQADGRVCYWPGIIFDQGNPSVEKAKQLISSMLCCPMNVIDVQQFDSNVHPGVAGTQWAFGTEANLISTYNACTKLNEILRGYMYTGSNGHMYVNTGVYQSVTVNPYIPGVQPGDAVGGIWPPYIPGLPPNAYDIPNAIKTTGAYGVPTYLDAGYQYNDLTQGVLDNDDTVWSYFIRNFMPMSSLDPEFDSNLKNTSLLPPFLVPFYRLFVYNASQQFPLSPPLVAIGNEVGFNKNPEQEVPCVCWTTVEVDLLTGINKLLDVKFIEDCGYSVNPVFDAQQLDGSFLFGLDYFLRAENLYEPGTVRRTTADTWEFKPIGISDTPSKFTVELWSNTGAQQVGQVPFDPTQGTTFGGKYCNELGTVASAAVFLAIKQAIREYRQSSSQSSRFELKIPALPYNIRNAANISSSTYNLS